MAVVKVGAVADAAAASAAEAAALVPASAVAPPRCRHQCHHRSMLMVTAAAAVAAATVVALSWAAAADGAALPQPLPPTATTTTTATTASVEPAVPAATPALATASWDAPDLWDQPPLLPPPSSLSLSSSPLSSRATGAAEGQILSGGEDMAGGAEEAVRLTDWLRSEGATASATAVEEAEGGTVDSSVPGIGSGSAGTPRLAANVGGKAPPGGPSAPSGPTFAPATSAASSLPPSSMGGVAGVVDPPVIVVPEEFDAPNVARLYAGGASAPPLASAISGGVRPPPPLPRLASPVAGSAGTGVTVSDFGEDSDPPAGLIHPPSSRATDTAGGVVAEGTTAASVAASVSNTVAITTAVDPGYVATPSPGAIGGPSAREVSRFFPYGRAWPPTGARPFFFGDHASALFEASAVLRRLAESEVAAVPMPPLFRASGDALPSPPTQASVWTADVPAEESLPLPSQSPPPPPPLPPPLKTAQLSSPSSPPSLSPSPSPPMPSPSRSLPPRTSRPTLPRASLPQPPLLPSSPPPPLSLPLSRPPPQQRSSVDAPLTSLPSPSLPSASFRSPPPPPPLGRVAAPTHPTVSSLKVVLRSDEVVAANAATARCKAANQQLMLAHNMRDFHDEGGSRAFKASLWALRQLLRDTDGQQEGGVGSPSSAGTDGVQSSPRRREPGMVVDVGANRGQSIETWASLFPGGNVILVEGNPSTAKVLEGVVAKRQQAAALGQARGVAAVKVVCALVGNTTRVVTFRSSINGRSSELSGVFADGSPKIQLTEFEYLKIPMDTLDNVLRVATRDLAPNLRVPPHPPTSSSPVSPVAPRRKYLVDLLKTDTEGWDVVALAGAPETLATTRMVLWECHMKMATEGGPRTTHKQAAALLAAAGFESYKLSAAALLRFDGDWYDARLEKGRYMGWHNCLAIRRDDPARPQVLARLNGLPACIEPWGLNGK